MQIVEPRLDHVTADTPAASAVPLSEGAETSASIGQSLPNPGTHKSSRLDADVPHESDIPISLCMICSLNLTSLMNPTFPIHCV